MFKKMSNKDLDEFSKSLARELARQYESGSEDEALSKKSRRKLGKALDKIYLKAADFQLQHKLGIYGKARLGNTFKWELKERGYKETFVDEATKGLILSLNRN
jgi:hypothetical protein